MRLTVCLPDRIMLDSEVSKVIAESETGSFCLLPRHIDYVATLVPGILSYERVNQQGEEFLAVDEGLLVKCGSDVKVSTRNAVLSKDLGRLKQTVEDEFLELDEQERKSRSIITKLETDFVRSILGLRR
jgi:F-type H+-transporting ATPase subunit epsilon